MLRALPNARWGRALRSCAPDYAHTRKSGPGSVLEEIADQFRHRRRLFERRHVRRLIDQLDARVGNQRLELLGIDRLGQAVLLAPDDQRRRGDSMSALAQALV